MAAIQLWNESQFFKKRYNICIPIFLLFLFLLANIQKKENELIIAISIHCMKGFATTARHRVKRERKGERNKEYGKAY